MTERDISRRELLATGGAFALAAVAGCTSGSTDVSGGAAGAPEGGSTDSGASASPTDSHEAGHHGKDNTHHGETKHSDGHEHEHGSLPNEPASEATVAMKTTDAGYHFDPHVVWVESGATVTFELESGTHTATAYAKSNDTVQRIPEDAEAFDSGTLSEKGATFEHTFETEGVYDYYCRPHESMGMIGSIVVGKPDAHGQPGLTEPQDALPKKARSKITDLNAKVDEILGHTHGSDESDGEHDGKTTESGHHDGTTEGGHHSE